MAVDIALRSVPDQFVAKLGLSELYWRVDDEGGFGNEGSGPVRDLFDSVDTILYRTEGKRHNVIQAGGNCGLYARWYSQHFDNVFTFEPTRGNFEALSINAAQVDNIWCFNCALGDGIRPYVKIRQSYEDNCGADTYEPSDESGEAPCLSLDQIALNLGPIDIIHLDCEGYEPNILRGALKLIERDHPVIIIENPDKLNERLKELGYTGCERLHSDQIFVYKG